jgi:hypothetical protein
MPYFWATLPYVYITRYPAVITGSKVSVIATIEDVILIPYYSYHYLIHDNDSR